MSRRDVIIAGAGPAGSTTAALLARRGVDVLVLEKEEFPRFHIGESLLPAGMPVHEELGLEFDEAVSVYKGGARFVCERTNREVAFDFGEAMEGCAPHAYQVERSAFDRQLRDVARREGAEVIHGVAVADVAVREDGVTVQTSQGIRSARFFVDATGQDRLIAKRRKAVEPIRGLGRAAAFTHFSNLTDEAMAAIGEGNDIRIVMIDNGWGWMIPLPGRRLSLGVVSQTEKVSVAWLDEHLAGSPLAREWTAGATRGTSSIVSNFSFRNTASSGARYACVGDAACFLDPVFSSGVAMAMCGGSMSAAVIADALAAGRESDPRLMAPVEAEMARAYATLTAFIDRFYNRRIVENLFFGAPPDGDMRSAVISVLAGDVWRHDNPFQDMLLNAKRRRAAV